VLRSRASLILRVDLDRLRLSQNFADLVGVKKQLVIVSVCKPHPHWFIRVHPEWQLSTFTLTVEGERGRETYIVDPGLWDGIRRLLAPSRLVVGISRQNAVFVWPLRLPSSDGRTNTWNESALAAAKLAETQWVRVASNTAIAMYEIVTATAQYPEPEWPDVGFQRVIELAFQGRFIQSADHPVLRKLAGEI
jgi:hypothetical protein